MKVFKALFVLSLLFIFLTSWPQVWADRGGFSPLGHEVFESGQKAIIGWNGTDEILILSSDVNSSQESLVIEFLPLPSNPDISKGEKDSFIEVEILVGEYFDYTGFRTISHTRAAEGPYGGVEITFHQIIGVHDLTVVKAEDAQELISWTEDFLNDIQIEYEELPSGLEDVFSVYVDEGINFFAVDVIDVNSTTRSVDPLVYEFKSSRLYYPLRISTLFSGDTDISLFTITTRELNDESILKEGFQKMAKFNIKPEALIEINPSMAEMFSNNPCLCFYKYEGSLNNLKSDISAGFSFFKTISVMAVTAFSLGTSLTLLFLLFPKKRIASVLHGNH